MDLPRFHRLRRAFYRLEGSCCAGCGREFFPSRDVCAECGSANQLPVALPRRGRVISFTRVYQPPRGFASSSTGVTALVELARGVRVTAQLTDVDPEDARIGMEVEMVVRRLQADDERGLIVYGYKFRPPVPCESSAEEGES